MLGAVKTVPEFGRDPKIISLDPARLDRPAQACTGLNFVAIVARTVKVPVPAINCRSNNISGDFRLDLPEAQSNRRKFDAAGKLDGFAGNDAGSPLRFVFHHVVGNVQIRADVLNIVVVFQILQQTDDSLCGR